MDYVVGGVAALISGNVTPNRPRLVRKALTPIKHQQSPNVTPKSELVDDRSIFLSPSVQKKKALIKKSPKRIFQNPDLDVTNDSENNSSPKADKVKKHLQGELEGRDYLHSSDTMPKCPSSKKKQIKSGEAFSPKKSFDNVKSPQTTPKKKNKKSLKTVIDSSKLDEDVEMEINEDNEMVNGEELRNKSKSKQESASEEEDVNDNNKVLDVQIKSDNSPKKKSKKKKKKPNNVMIKSEISEQPEESKDITTIKTKVSSKKLKKNKGVNFVNPNAITNEDSDSEHESDNEIVSENDEANKEMLDTGPADESSEEEEIVEKKEPKVEKREEEVRTEEEIKRTLFVGNVPFSTKCKKEVKKIFTKYGEIETVRIRTIPVKDARVTPKLAVIRNELHPERTTVNVYVKYKHESSVEQALCENNTVLNECHLRVSRSGASGAEHDPRCAVFVGNVPFALEDDGLRDKFAKCGEIVSVRIIRDKKTNAGKGFAYVNFASKDGVELALALPEEDLTIKNRILRVKRCMQATQRQKNQDRDSKPNFHNKKHGNFQNKNPGHMQGRSPGHMQARNPGHMQGKSSGHTQGKGSWQMQGKGPGYAQGKGQGKNKVSQGFRQRGPNQDAVGEGAQRRIMNKRKSQDAGEGPEEKRQKHVNHPQREKKVKKEFVGMTAEKKKKHTFNKGQKKKRALSEILTK